MHSNENAPQGTGREADQALPQVYRGEPDTHAPKPDYDATIEFLGEFRPGGPWSLVWIWPDGHPRNKPVRERNRGKPKKEHEPLPERDLGGKTFYPGQETQMRGWIARHNELGKGIYFHVNRRRSYGKSRATASEVASLDYLHVDVDPVPGELLSTQQERIVKRLQSPPEKTPPATLITFSGGGYQGFWALGEPLAIEESKEAVADAKLWNKQLEVDFDADACHNIDRIMRLPGTINYPKEAKRTAKGQRPALAEVVEWHPERVYSLDQFQKAEPTAGKASQPADESKQGGASPRPSADIRSLRVHDAVKDWILRGTEADSENRFDRDRSKQLASVVRHLWNGFHSIDEIYGICLDPALGISAHPLDQDDPERAIENAVELASKDARPIRNSVSVIVDDDDGKKKRIRHRLPLNRITEHVLDLFGLRLFRMSGSLILDHGEGLQVIDDVNALFAQLHREGQVQWVGGSDDRGNNFVSRQELRAALITQARQVEEVSEYPLHPTPRRVYITGRLKPTGSGDGSVLAELVAMFAPASEIDRILIEAMIVTLVWGGPPGKRPMFVVTGPQHTGKTKLIELIASVIGGEFKPLLTSRSGDALSKQLLADCYVDKRVVLFDNLTGYTRNPEIASLVTSQWIDGRASHGVQKRRANYMIWAATTTDPRLDTDLATRSFLVELAPPTQNPQFETEVARFIEKNRPEIIGDCLAKLRGSPGTIDPKAHSRFPEWDAQVLGVVTPRATEVLLDRRGRIKEVNEDLEALGLFHQELPTLALNGPVTEVTARELTDLWNRANGTSVDAGWLVRRLREYDRRGVLTPALRRRWEKRNGSPWVFEAEKHCLSGGEES